MAGKTFGETLRSLREREKLSVKEVIGKLKQYGLDITDKTLYSYENDKRASSADMLLALCQIYNCNNILETFAGFEPDYSIPDDSEWKLIEKYRSLDSAGKNTVDTVIEQETERSKEVLELLKRIQELENASPSTIIDIQAHQEDSSRLIEYFHNASAGTGVFILGNETVDQLAIPDTPENRKVDYAIKVSGDSMEPDYYDGDIVLVSQNVELNHGDVGIFIVNNNAYIKEYGETELISRNPEVSNIVISEYDNIVCMGKVVGKYEI